MKEKDLLEGEINEKDEKIQKLREQVRNRYYKGIFRDKFLLLEGDGRVLGRSCMKTVLAAENLKKCQ